MSGWGQWPTAELKRGFLNLLRQKKDLLGQRDKEKAVMICELELARLL